MSRKRLRGGETLIRYCMGPTPVGPAFLAFTDQGLCALHLIAESELPRALALVRRRFPRARPRLDPQAGTAVLRQVRALIAGRSREVEVYLDLGGTPFQRRVWQALREVPRGSTCSYTELARRIGRPRAVRAVANACAGNPVAVIVPCHRIVRQNGSLGGYRWGLPRKRALLRCEQHP